MSFMLSLLCILYYLLGILIIVLIIIWISVLLAFPAFTVMINTCYDLAKPLQFMPT